MRLAAILPSQEEKPRGELNDIEHLFQLGCAPANERPLDEGGPLCKIDGNSPEGGEVRLGLVKSSPQCR